MFLNADTLHEINTHPILNNLSICAFMIKSDLPNLDLSIFVAEKQLSSVKENLFKAKSPHSVF